MGLLQSVPKWAGIARLVVGFSPLTGIHGIVTKMMKADELKAVLRSFSPLTGIHGIVTHKLRGMPIRWVNSAI